MIRCHPEPNVLWGQVGNGNIGMNFRTIKKHLADYYDVFSAWKFLLDLNAQYYYFIEIDLITEPYFNHETSREK